MLERWFEYESGHPWCESAYRYQTLPMVAEFANTVTNLPIMILPMVNAMLLRKYIKEVNSLIFWPHLLLTINGIASTYYHATINLFGQLVDELSLVWLLAVCLTSYIPIMKCFPVKFHKYIPKIRSSIGIFTILVSILCFIEPSLNAIALMLFSIPGCFVIYYEGKNSGIEEAARCVDRIFLLWGLAATFWVSDRIFCDFWLYIEAPYLHAIFHILASWAGYTCFLMFSLIDIHKRSQEHGFIAKVKYIPSNINGILSLPYITFIEDKIE
uniref:Alkaline ceramidase n=1 Tax=Parastrongyloides trichosuri TaxID=131310 RepID=A0A0N4ZB82_PARTI